MFTKLPLLIYEDLLPTRNYLQDITLVLSSMQRAFLPQDSHDWHYGLEVSMRGISTQQFMIGNEPTRMLLDLVRNKVRIGDTNWSLEEYAAPEIIKNIRVWLEARGISVALEQPKFSSHSLFNEGQAGRYADSLWWLDARFRNLKDTLQQGSISPILLYAHHFDLSLVWFPHSDERQLGLGYSTGDDTIAEPYLYLTMYPLHADFGTIELPDAAHWQTQGFHGAVLTYAALQASPSPESLFTAFVSVAINACYLLD